MAFVIRFWNRWIIENNCCRNSYHFVQTLTLMFFRVFYLCVFVLCPIKCHFDLCTVFICGISMCIWQNRWFFTRNEVDWSKFFSQHQNLVLIHVNAINSKPFQHVPFEFHPDTCHTLTFTHILYFSNAKINIQC